MIWVIFCIHNEEFLFPPLFHKIKDKKCLNIYLSCFHIFFQILIISYIAVVNCNPQFLYHIINQQPYPYQHFGPPLIWFQGPPIIHSPYPFGKIQGQIEPKDQKKSPYSVDTG